MLAQSVAGGDQLSNVYQSIIPLIYKPFEYEERQKDKKDREQKLQDYKARMNSDDVGLKSQPRKSSTVVDNSHKKKDDNIKSEPKEENDKSDENVAQ